MTTKEENDLIGEFVEALSSSVYQRGYKNGIADGNINDGTFAKKIQEAYENGLNNVWEYVEKLGQLTIKEIYEIFGVEYDNIYGIIADYTPTEFIDAIKEYEDKQKKMRENCSILNDTCPYDIPCAECEVHCSVERAKQKLKGDKE